MSSLVSWIFRTDGDKHVGSKADYQLNDKVQKAAMLWQYAEQARIRAVDTSSNAISYSTKTGITVSPVLDVNTELMLRRDENEAEKVYNRAVDEFAKKKHFMALLSKSKKTNILTIFILTVWAAVIITSILPINVKARPRDVAETVLEFFEKILYFLSITAKSRVYRIAAFIIVACFSVVEKALEIHYDPAPDRVANGSWSLLGAISAKVLENLAFAARLEPSSNAWQFWTGEAEGRMTTYLSVEQLARRRIWARAYFKEQLLSQFEVLANKVRA